MDGARGVITVTGGPDMALMEVNEALTIIQEAAHEDANIIFGAVVDPQLQGRVKITVIATGFDLAKPSRAAASGAPTPVDMNMYAAKARALPPAVDPVVSPAGRVTITRRPSLDVGRTLVRAVGGIGPSAAGPSDDGVDPPNPLDVPAFLRRGDA